MSPDDTVKEAVRKLLKTQFEINPERLCFLCYDSYSLRELYMYLANANKLRTSEDFDKLVNDLVEIASAKNLLGTLHDQVQRKVQEEMKLAEEKRKQEEIERQKSIKLEEKQRQERLERQNIESPYSTMDSESKFYIKRETDEQCLNILNHSNGETLIIKGASQVGKSSFMRHILDTQRAEKHIAFIDFQILPKESLDKPRKFFRHFCQLLGDSLNVPDKTGSYWQGRSSDTIECNRYLTQHIFSELQNSPFIIAIDGVDKIFRSTVGRDFYAILRTWHNNRAIRPKFKQLTLFLSISTEPDLLISELTQSPFNVGETISLEDFTFQEVYKLNELHGNPLTDNQNKELVNMLGGHPFLTRLALYHLATQPIEWSVLQAEATNDNGLFGNHLRHHHIIYKKENLKNALKQVCQRNFLAEDLTFYELKAMGLIKKVGREIVFRNKLYERYFTEKLNASYL